PFSRGGKQNDSKTPPRSLRPRPSPQGGYSASCATDSVSSEASSITEHPAGDARIAPVTAVLGERLVVPECIRRCPVGQFEQQRGADVVGTVGGADRSAKNEAVAVRREV